MSSLLVICRSCGHEQEVGFSPQGRSFEPNECARCESDDIVPLRVLSVAELEELEAEVERRRGR